MSEDSCCGLALTLKHISQTFVERASLCPVTHMDHSYHHQSKNERHVRIKISTTVTERVQGENEMSDHGGVSACILQGVDSELLGLGGDTAECCMGAVMLGGIDGRLGVLEGIEELLPLHNDVLRWGDMRHNEGLTNGVEIQTHKGVPSAMKVNELRILDEALVFEALVFDGGGNGAVSAGSPPLTCYVRGLPVCGTCEAHVTSFHIDPDFVFVAPL
ncbi:unnamed protein product [Pleuronectes platessa]|uniref:Uncharacterized protein n=1 Tax=Pleuronectes platessa TaxID=8262 RepID=A0A9N7U4C0_PLEPL|nr:unnamed protein product [Pleuronectes platessa]